MMNMINKKDKVFRENQRELICRYRAKSYSFREIAEMVSGETGVKVSHVTVFNYYMSALEEAKKQAESAAAYSLISQLEKLDRLEHQYWRAWEKSIGKTSKKKVRKNGQKKDLGTQVEAEETEQNGDVSFLNGIKSCIELRCKLMGSLTTKIDVTTGGEKVEFKGFGFLPYTPVADAEEEK
jgi:hypothetical protein